jgi:hypothetical protein
MRQKHKPKQIADFLSCYGIILKEDKTFSGNENLYRDLSYFYINSDNGIMINVKNKHYCADYNLSNLQSIITLQKIKN